MRRSLYIAAPATLLVCSGLFIWLGVYVYTYRDHLHTTDPTGYHVNDMVSFGILAPGSLGALLSLGVLIYRLVQVKHMPVAGAQQE